MDNQQFEMMRDRFDNLDHSMRTLNETMQDHVMKDEAYWKKLDQAEGQLSLIRWVMGGLSVSGLMAWVFNHFGKP
jgi:fermentation-respiration switch protein FrsA (DUF1100 family)